MKQKTERLYVAYGSNLNHQQMAIRCPTAKYVGSGKIPNHALAFHGVRDCAFATIVPDETQSVPCGVWAITSRDEQSLDTYEGVAHGHYSKAMINVDMDDGTTREALVYIMNPQMRPGVPTHAYFNTIGVGYFDCDLDCEFLKKALEDAISVVQSEDERAEEELFEDEDMGDSEQGGMKFE